VQGLRTLPMALRLPSSDDAALFALRVACGVGTIGLGGHALMRALNGFSPNSSMLDLFNSSDAYASAGPATVLQLANGATMAFPPGFEYQVGQEGAGDHVAKLPPGLASMDTVAANSGAPSVTPRPPVAAAPALPPNPYGAADPDPQLPSSLDKEAAAQSAYADAVAAYAAAKRSYHDDLVAAIHADGAAMDADPTASPHAMADLDARNAALAADVDAAKAAADLAAGESQYYEDWAAARDADAAARTADPFATPHGVRDLQNDAQLKADELRARVAAANAKANAAAAEKAYLDHLEAAKAEDAAARAADPNAAPHAADDVRAGAEAARQASAEEVAAANARADAARAARDPAGMAADEASAADARVEKAWYRSNAEYYAAKAEAAAAHAKAEAAAKKAYEEPWKWLKG
jgi:hypothetical protein